MRNKRLATSREVYARAYAYLSLIWEKENIPLFIRQQQIEEISGHDCFVFPEGLFTDILKKYGLSSEQIDRVMLGVE